MVLSMSTRCIPVPITLDIPSNTWVFSLISSGAREERDSADEQNHLDTGRPPRADQNEYATSYHNTA
jgi:hypothetical protein